MSDHFEEQQAKTTFEWLSAMTDGEAGEREVAAACSAWKAQPESRERWHAYQLIGDVMRSETLADNARGDADFLHDFRARLAQEPVVLAPAAQQAASLHAGSADRADRAGVASRQRRWAGPAAVAAGFVMVLGVAMNTFQGAGLVAQPPSTLAEAQPAGSAADMAPASPVLASSGWVGDEASALSPALRSGLVADSLMADRPSFIKAQAAESTPGTLTVIRDAQLDEFLAAHRQLTEEGVFAPPAALVRSVAFEAPQRR